MISREEVLNLATLARLSLSQAEVERLQKDISNILDYVGQVSAVAIDSRWAPSAGSADGAHLLHNVMREDIPRTSEDPLIGKEEKLKEAFPRRENNFNVVRKIIQKDE